MNEPIALEVGSRVRFQPTGHGPYANGIILSWVDMPTGFVHVIGQNGNTYATHRDSLLPPEPENYVTDRHSISSATICPRCLRAHDPKKPINCECGYTTDKPVSEIWQSGTVGIADRAGAFIFPEPDEATKEEIKLQIRKKNDRMVMPRSLGYSNIEKLSLGPDDILVFHCPAGDSEAAEHCRAVLLDGEIKNPCVLLPDGFDLKTMPLNEARAFRDRLNETIYDREHAR